MIHIGQRTIGAGHPCLITFEAGPTHNSLDSAKKLASLAAEAGADAIKFQIFDPDKLVADKSLPFSYDILLDRESGETRTVTEPLYDILCRRCLSTEEWKELKQHCDALHLAFFSTVGFEEDIRLLEELCCDSIKIASADINHWPLIRRAARTGMTIQLDTGNATLGEVEEAVEVCLAEGNDNIIIHNCPSGYPARLESINLRLISSLKMLFPNYPIAYSDHTPSWEMDVAAVAIGADMVEKTITLDRTTPSVEHIFSLEPEEMKAFITVIRDTERALGATRRILLPAELEKRQAIRRSAYTGRAVKAGETVTINTLEFRRPGYGISPRDMESLIGSTYLRDIEAGTPLQYSDIAKKS